MRTKNLTCVWEPSATYYMLLIELRSMINDYWTRGYQSDCPDHRPLIRRLSFADGVLVLLFTLLLASLQVRGRQTLKLVSSCGSWDIQLRSS